MPKLSIDELQCIVMEGGGARGTAYLGAIRSLEEQLYAHRTGGKYHLYKDDGDDKDKKGNSVMNYYNDSDKSLKIKGVAGSSAGAITTYALALGLNSIQIEAVLGYSFKEFLSEKSVGKYRMVDENSELKVGEDDKKQLGQKKEDFVYSNTKDRQKVNGNFLKLAKRNAIIMIVLKVVLDGVVKNVDQIFNSRVIKRNFGKLNLGWSKVVGFFRFLGQKASFFGVGAVIWKGLAGAAFKLLSIKSPIKMDADIIGNVIFDRGMFSGFAVREFFYDLTVFALTRDTHFQRKILEKFQYDSDVLSMVYRPLGPADLTHEFTIGKRSETKFPPHLDQIFEYIKNMTFRDLYELLGVDYGLCVSNYSTGLPIYFSYEWTPDFRVLEGVAASMTIPPAIKPLYNEADVVFYSTGSARKGRNQQINVTSSPIPGVGVNPKGTEIHEFVKSDGTFNQTDYYFYEFVVKKMLQQLIKEEKDITISVNNDIDISNFLPSLRRLVVGDLKGKTETEKKNAINQNKTYEVNVEGRNYKVTYNLLAFFYNARYKGMLLDGGYRNNIPYNFFRSELTKESSIEGVLALKLDGNFPTDLMHQIRQGIPDFLKKEEEVYEFVNSRLNAGIQITEIMKDPEFAELDDKAMEALTLKTKAIFKKYYDQLDLKEETRKSLDKDKEGVYKLMKAVVEKYKEDNNIKPWAKPISILGTAADGYAYGTEKGQIRFLSDHNHIIPLFDCGVGTYDFDMTKVRPMAFLSQEMSKADTDAYFSTR